MNYALPLQDSSAGCFFLAIIKAATNTTATAARATPAITAIRVLESCVEFSGCRGGDDIRDSEDEGDAVCSGGVAVDVGVGVVSCGDGDGLGVGVGGIVLWVATGFTSG